MKEMVEAYDKVTRVIQSCETKAHIRTARKMLRLFRCKYFFPKKYSVLYYRRLENELFLKEDEFVWF